MPYYSGMVGRAQPPSQRHKGDCLGGSMRYMQRRDVAVRERVSAHRARMRAQGLRPVQIWVPDVRSPDVAAEAHRQSALVAAADGANDDMDFVEAVSDDWNE